MPQQSQLPEVLLITRNLPPLLGGMERLNLHLARELTAGYRLKVIGPTGCRAFLPLGTVVFEIPAKPLPLFLLWTFAAAWRAGATRPKFVIAGSGLTAPMANVAARRGNAVTIAYVHGLDLVARHPIYRLGWIPSLRKLRHVFANSVSTADIAARLGVAGRHISVLHPGVSMPEENPDSRAAFRGRHGLGCAKVLLSVGRMTPRKGLLEFLRNSFPEIVSRHPDATLVVVGNEAPDALRGQGRGMAVQLMQEAARLGLQDRIRILGVLDDAGLGEAFAAADAHIFPVCAMADDVEGFGMVAIEAAAHGLPTVAFAVGGVPDAVRPGESGWLVAPGDYAGFADCVCDLLNVDVATMQMSARAFADGFRWERFGERLRSALAQIDNGRAKTSGRGGHAVLDLQSRATKARKIEALLGLQGRSNALRMLEIGTGSGGIAHYFANHPTLNIEVDAIDVVDTRQINEGYRFTKVDGPSLPFPDGIFDIVITNHVIEHVGDERAQRDHLTEVRRVLAPHGVAYLAVPNRWMLVEPHFGLAFLSWLPRRLRTPYLRWRRGIAEYDCEPLSLAKAEGLFRDAGLAFENLTVPALRKTLDLEGQRRSLSHWLARRLPDRLALPLVGLIPTLIFRLWRDEGCVRVGVGTQ